MTKGLCAEGGGVDFRLRRITSSASQTIRSHLVRTAMDAAVSARLDAFRRLSQLYFSHFATRTTCMQCTIRYDSVYLTCSKKLTASQLSLPNGINKKIKCETKNKMVSVIGPVQSRYREAVQ